MATNVNYAATPLCGSATLTTADTSRTNPSTTVTLVSSATYPNGAQIERISVIPVADTVVSVIRIFRYDGSAYHLYMEIPVEAETLSATVSNDTQSYQAASNPDLFPIMIPAGWSLRATVNNTQTGISINAEGGGF